MKTTGRLITRAHAFTISSSSTAAASASSSSSSSSSTATTSSSSSSSSPFFFPLLSPRTIAHRASSTVSCENLNPRRSVSLGSTRCPSNTTVAPSPRSNRSATPGTGSQFGRFVAAETASHRPFIVVGSGAVPFSVPSYFSGSSNAATINATRSSRWIHEKRCDPSPRGPPPYSWKMGKIFPSAPPPFSRTTPVRTIVVGVSAFFASRSHFTHRRARKSRPGAEFSSNVFVLEVP
mmetsp:Transcript_302/g.992  ORF Transcript_302/g.992 Transcript_302/m.992 type:complete len:235 (+) Transcript_302:710-1414(+)|eukprot:31562-Pelagococcus_subviridis.AAC.7